MKPCWVLVVTRGLGVWLPPEVYLQHGLAIREVDRWRDTLRLPVSPPKFTPTSRCLHLIATEFPDSWRACPVWVGVTWSVKSYPRLKAELMAADEREAADWLRHKTPKGVMIDAATRVDFERRGVLTSVGVAQVKRVIGM